MRTSFLLPVACGCVILAPVSAGPLSLDTWAANPLVAGDTTFTFLSSSGLTTSAVQVEATESSPHYELKLSSLSGHAAASFELKYQVDIAGTDWFDTVGLGAQAAQPGTSVTATVFSDQFFNTIAAQPQTVVDTDAVSGGAVDGIQRRLYVWVQGTLNDAELDWVVTTSEQRSVPEPAATMAWTAAGIGAYALGLRWRRRSAR